MAASFTVNSGSYQGRYLSLTCTQTIDIAANLSRIDWTLTSTGGSVNYYTTGPTTVSIGGRTVYSIGQKTYTSQQFPAAKGSVSGTEYFNHNADGTLSLWVGLSTAIYYSTVNSYGGTWYLDTIPRAAQLLSAPNFNANNDKPTVTYSNPAGTAADVQVSIYNPDGNTHYAGYRSASATGTSYTFNLTTDERNALINAVPSGTDTMYVNFYIRTLINGAIVDGSIRSLSRKMTVHRKATITSAPNFNDEANPTIKYSNPNGSAVDKIQVGIYGTDGSTTYAAYRDVSKTGTSYTFNLTAAEREALIAATPSGKSTVSVRFYIATYIGGSVFGRHYVTKTLTVVNTTPTATYSLKDTGTASTALTNDNSVMIKGFNYIAASMTPSLKKGASVTAKSITNGSTVVKNTSASFNNSENNTFNFEFTDSFGNKVTKQLTLTQVNYVKLTCDVSGISSSVDGKMSFKISGNYFNSTFGTNGDTNTLTVKWRIKKDNGSYGSWTTVTPTKSGNKYNVTVNTTGDYQSTYTVQAMASDLLNTSGTTSPERVIKTLPVFNWGKNNFDVNVTMYVDALRCQNSFDGKLEQGSYDSNTGAKQTNTSCYRNVNIISVEPNAEYYLTVDGTTKRFVMLFYDSSQNFLSENRIVTTDGRFTVPKSARYVNFRCFQEDYNASFASLTVCMYKYSPARIPEPVKYIYTTGTDLNYYVHNGTYWFGSSYTPTNIPTGVNGWLIVMVGSGDFIKQIWLRAGTANSNDHQTFVRTRADGKTWSSWKQFVVPDANNNVSLPGALTTGGKITLPSSVYLDSGAGALDLANSDITRVNAMYFNDECTGDEGVNFLKQNGDKSLPADYETLRGYRGKLYYDNNLIHPIVQLYNNSSGSAGTITLGDSSANYTYIEIFFRDNNNRDCNSEKIYSPNGKTTSLSTTEASTATNTLFRRTRYTISGTSVTPDTSGAGYAQINNTVPSTNAGGNYIIIYRIIGYK